jgi:RND family efflux transporter MFP subunit
MTMNSRTIVPAAAAVLLMASGCGHDKAKLETADFEPLTVRTQTVEKISAARPIEVRGVVRAANESSVSSRVTGPIIEVRVKAGDRVRESQPLLVIQPDAITGQVEQASGALAQAQAVLTLAERNFHRFEALHDDNAASDLELDRARMDYEQARGAVEQARGAVQSARSVADESIVKSPFDGRIVDTLVDVGDLAAPGRPLVTVESLSNREFWLTVRAADIDRFETGQRLGVVLDSRTMLGPLQATVHEIIPSGDPATHTFTVKASLSENSVMSGITGRAILDGDVSSRIVVPATAVHRRGGLELVVVRASDGTARTRAVTTGQTLDGNRIEILSGLDEGEEIVVDTPAAVPDGTPLEVLS